MRERLEQMFDRPRRPDAVLSGGQGKQDLGACRSRRGLLEGTAQVRDGAFGGAFRERAVGCGPEQADNVSIAARRREQELTCDPLRRSVPLGEERRGSPVRGPTLRCGQGVVDGSA